MSVPTRLEFKIFELNTDTECVFSVVYGDFVIEGFRVINNKGTLKVQMPPRTFEMNGETHTAVAAWLPDEHRAAAFERFVLDQYKRELEHHLETLKSAGA